MEKYSQIFFSSYKMAVEAAYNDFLKITEGDFPGLNNEDEGKLKEYLQNENKKWICTPLEELGNNTPLEYLKTVTSLDLLTGMFTYGAVACDDGLPEIFLDKLKSYGEEAIDALIVIATQKGAGDSEDEFLASLMAVEVLGTWKAERAVEPIIRLLNPGFEVHDLIYEKVRDALVSVGAPALDSICNALDSGLHTPTAIEYLLMAVTDIGRKNKCDKMYLQLKKAFVENERKLIAASCLGNYGDGRAIPALRGFLQKNTQTLDKETFYEIISAIQRLGGRIDDLNY